MPEYTLKVNGKSVTVDVDADTPLLWVLRDELNMVGTKFGVCTMWSLCSFRSQNSLPISIAQDRDSSRREWVSHKKRGWWVWKTRFSKTCMVTLIESWKNL